VCAVVDAERVKKIKNKVVVNESPTDKLIRELKEENARLLKLVSKSGSSTSDDELQRMIAENARELEAMHKTWEDKLREARQAWEAETQLTRGTTMAHQGPRLHNLNEDPQVLRVTCE
jgi:kinesin family protein 1